MQLNYYVLLRTTQPAIGTAKLMVGAVFLSSIQCSQHVHERTLILLAAVTAAMRAPPECDAKARHAGVCQAAAHLVGPWGHVQHWGVYSRGRRRVMAPL